MLPNFELSSDEEEEILRQKAQQTRRVNRKKAKEEASGGGGGLLDLSLSDEDTAANAVAAAKRAQRERRAKAAEELREAEAEKEAQRQRSAQTLESLFAKFNITLDDDDDDPDLLSKPSSPPPQKRTLAPKAATKSKPPAALAGEVGGLNTRTVLMMSGSGGRAIAKCVACGAKVPYSSDPNTSVRCTSCGKYFVPVHSAKADGRCKCGIAKKGSCFVCGE